MILRAQQIFDKVMLDRSHLSEFLDHLSYGIKRELVNKLIDELDSHKLYVVQLEEPKFIEDSPVHYCNQAAYRQNLHCMKLVQCKNCRRAFSWCQRFRDELGGIGFCPYGVEAEDVIKKIEEGQVWEI